MMNTENNTQSLPCNPDAERMLLGSLLLNPDAMLELTGLKAADFYIERNGWIYAAMLSLTEKRLPVDFTMLASELEAANRLEDVGGPAYLAGLIDGTPTAIYAGHYAGLVLDAAARRRHIAAAAKIVAMAYDPATPLPSVRADAQRLMLEATGDTTGNGPHSIAKLVPAAIEDIFHKIENPNQAMGLPTGFHMLDGILNGLQRTDLIILAGRPGTGKSSLGMTIVHNAAKRHGARVAMFSLEMSEEQLVMRLLSMETGLAGGHLKSGRLNEDEQAVLMLAAQSLSELPMMIDDTPGLPVADMRAKSHRLHATHGLDLIVVDYLQLMAGNTGRKGENREQEIAYISRSLKNLAKELNVPVLALCQLSRAVEQRADKRPMLSDLRESGSIEQDADVVLMLYRDDYYNKESEQQNVAEVIIAKHRHGSTGTVSLYFRKELTQFRDLEIERYEFA
jgi:replicative DNA helicase